MHRCLASLYYLSWIGNWIRKIRILNSKRYVFFGSSTYLKDWKNMNKMVHCPNQGCRCGKVHYFVGFDIFWNDCPICGGWGSIKRSVPDNVIEYQNWRLWSVTNAMSQYWLRSMGRWWVHPYTQSRKIGLFLLLLLWLYPEPAGVTMETPIA